MARACRISCTLWTSGPQAVPILCHHTVTYTVPEFEQGMYVYQSPHLAVYRCQEDSHVITLLLLTLHIGVHRALKGECLTSYCPRARTMSTTSRLQLASTAPWHALQLRLHSLGLRPALEAPPDLARVVQLDAEVVRHRPHQPGVLLEHPAHKDDVRLALSTAQPSQSPAPTARRKTVERTLSRMLCATCPS